MDADGKVIIETEIDTKKFDYQVDYLQKKLDDMVADYTTMSQESTFNEQSADAVELRSNIEKLSNTIARYKGQMQEIDNQSNKTTENISKGIDKGVSKLKRFGLSLFSIRSIYSLVSRASSSYMQQDIELAEKLRSVWVGLGSFLAPVIEMMSDALLKGLGYLNVFIKALTGVDYIARANAKALNKQAQAQKNLNNQSYDFDVIRKQQDKSSGGSVGGSGTIELPELDEGLVKKLEKLAVTLKDNWYWIKEVGKVLVLTFGIVAMKKLLKGVGALIGSKGSVTGLLGLKGLLVGIAGAYVIKMYIDGYQKVKKELDELNGSLRASGNVAKTYTERTREISKGFRDLMKTGDLTDEHIQGWNKSLETTTDTIVNQYKELENNKTWWGELTGTNKEITKTQQELALTLMDVTADYEILYNQGKLTKDQSEKYSQALLEQIKIMNDLGYNTDDLKAKYEKLTGNKWTIDLYANDKASAKIDKLLEKYKKIINGDFTGNGGFSGGGGSRGQRFAQGGIVTQPTRALIGEAGYPEAVVPMNDEYLSTLASLISQYGGGNSGTTNVYLNGRLIQREVSKVTNSRGFAANR